MGPFTLVPQTSYHPFLLYYTTVPYLLFHTIPYYSILFHTIPYYSILYHTIPYYSILYHTIPYYSILYHTIPYYSIIRMFSIYGIVWHTIPYYSILYHTIPYYSIIRETGPCLLLQTQLQSMAPLHDLQLLYFIFLTFVTKDNNASKKP